MKKRFRKSYILAAVLLLLSAAAVCVNSSLSKRLTDRTLAETWSSERFQYARVSCFLHKDLAYGQPETENLHRSIDSALEQESLEAASKDARLWIDCWSAEGETSVASGENSVAARAFWVGGEFFQFHPLPMVSGWYFSDRDVMDDLVILDKELAWKLFGGYDLTGMDVIVAGYPCVIAGVADLPGTAAEKSAYGTEPAVYVSYSLLYKLGMTEPVTCYEAVIPDVVDGFAETILDNSIQIDASMCEKTVNSDRYTAAAAWGFLKGFFTRSQRVSEISLPWWENASRYMDGVSAMVLLLAGLFLLFPAAAALWLIIKAYKKRGAAFSALRRLIEALPVKIRERKSSGGNDNEKTF